MKLYYTPGACSLAPHIAAVEAKVPLDLVKVDLATHKTEKGEDFYQINPRGYVPALQFDDGEVMTEAQVLLQAIADMKPEAGLMPKVGTRERLRTQALLAYVSTELHKGFGPLWGAKAFGDQGVAAAKTNLAKRFKELNERLGKQDYLGGSSFTAADAYAFTILNWTKMHRIDLDEYPNLVAYQRRVAERPAVKQAMKEEGLV